MVCENCNSINIVNRACVECGFWHVSPPEMSAEDKLYKAKAEQAGMFIAVSGETGTPFMIGKVFDDGFETHDMEGNLTGRILYNEVSSSDIFIQVV